MLRALQACCTVNWLDVLRSRSHHRCKRWHQKAVDISQVCKSFQHTITSSSVYWDRLTGQLMTARFLAPSGYFTNSTFASFHRLVHDLMLCRDCGAFADWPAGQKICKQCCQVLPLPQTLSAAAA